MIKVVIATNVVVSANLVGERSIACNFEPGDQQKILMCVSPAVLAEYEEVLRRPGLKLNPVKIKDVLTLIRITSTFVLLTLTLGISEHESDNRFYECADAADAD